MMKNLFYFMCMLGLLSCAEDDGEEIVSDPQPSLGPPVFDTTFVTIPNKPKESFIYKVSDTINFSHHTIYHYNEAGEVAEEINFFEENKYYSFLQYWYEGERLIFQKDKEKTWYTRYEYNQQNQLQYGIQIDLQQEIPDTISMDYYYYFNGGSTIVHTNLPELASHDIPEGGYFYDSLLYEDGRLMEEYRKYGNGVDGVFLLQEKREYVYNEQNQLTEVRLVDGMNKDNDNGSFSPGVIEAYRYENGRLVEIRFYDAASFYSLTNIKKFIYPE